MALTSMQVPSEEKKLIRARSAGDRLCCLGLIIAGLCGYALVYWWVTSYTR